MNELKCLRCKGTIQLNQYQEGICVKCGQSYSNNNGKLYMD